MVNNNLFYVILCGGRSTRAGFDKGLFLRKGKPVVQILYEMLKENTNSKIFVSIREEQNLEYSKFFSKEELIFDKTNYMGPWNGIMSAHLTYPNKDLFILGCDLLNIDWKYILKLVQVYNKSSYDFYMYKDSKNIQTLCGIYNFKKLQKLYKANNFDMSIKKEVASSNAYLIPLHETEEPFFKNYNYLIEFLEI